MSATERNAETSDVFAAQRFLRASLASAVTVPVTSGHQDDLTLLGSATRLTLVTLHVPKGLHQGLYRLDIEMVPSSSGEGRFDLLAHERPARPTRPERRECLAHLYVEDHRQYRSRPLHLFRKTRTRRAADQWVDQWADPGISPRVVRLDVTFPAGDLRSWPTLLMPLEQAAP